MNWKVLGNIYCVCHIIIKTKMHGSNDVHCLIWIINIHKENDKWYCLGWICAGTLRMHGNYCMLNCVK